MIHGKRNHCINRGNEVVAAFENSSAEKLNIIIRAYNDGLAFRYEFPSAEKGTFVIDDELTAYKIPGDYLRWMEKWSLANEELYSFIDNHDVQQNWSYPALFCTADTSCWFLIHESDIDRSYCGTKLSNTAKASVFKVGLPDKNEGDGDTHPVITLPWRSPWRVVILGSLADIVESTLVDDVATPTKMTETEWIKPGKASWNYWSDNHGTKDYQVVCEFADLAAAMNWPYTLLDWEWDSMSNGGNVEDAVEYIHTIGVKPLIWYNSGVFKWIRATPRDRMLTHESRMKEFAWLKEMGIAGVKVDFFLSEKQNMIDYYLDILEDAAQHEMMIYYHGCLVPRGWSRTYPHLMTCEGVRGAEWYNNGPEFTATAPAHSTILPFTRNVVGAMDYTPVTFTNSQYPHITSYGHELALSVVFESGLQHMADRPSGYEQLPDAARTFLREVPVAWDDIKLLYGFPGQDVVLARRKGESWYIAGISAENREKQIGISFDFLPGGVKYKLTVIEDGEHDKALSTRYLVVDNTSSIEIKMLRRGGVAAELIPLN
jgi:alpha-glucosidase